jgi:chromosome segregation ATPase
LIQTQTLHYNSLDNFYRHSHIEITEGTMTSEKRNLKQELRSTRKKNKRLEDSRSSIKTKYAEKGIVIKKLKDRQRELEESRDHWKSKHKQIEDENTELAEKYAYLAKVLNIKEEQLREVLGNIEELKKKYPQMCR